MVPNCDTLEGFCGLEKKTRAFTDIIQRKAKRVKFDVECKVQFKRKRDQRRPCHFQTKFQPFQLKSKQPRTISLASPAAGKLRTDSTKCWIFSGGGLGQSSRGRWRAASGQLWILLQIISRSGWDFVLAQNYPASNEKSSIICNIETKILDSKNTWYCKAIIAWCYWYYGMLHA